MSLKTKLERAMFKMMHLPTCEEVEKFAYDFLDGHLETAEVKAVKWHLKLCKGCQRFLQSYKKVRELGREIKPLLPLDREFKNEIYEFLIRRGTR